MTLQLHGAARPRMSMLGMSEARKRIVQAGLDFAEGRRRAAAQQAAAQAEREGQTRAEAERQRAAWEARVGEAVRELRRLATERAAAGQPIPRKPGFAWSAILDEVCAQHGVPHALVLSVARTAPIIAARHEVMYRLAAETAMSLPQIGRKLGRDHTSVLHGIRVHARRRGLPLPRRPSTINPEV